MKFRPCIDIHNGKVKQIVGGTLLDTDDSAKENFVSKQDGGFYGALYRKHNLFGGHVILLNSMDSPYYEETKTQALKALKAYPKGLQVGGGMNPKNSEEFLKAGASHVIVTSYVFHGGCIHMDRLEEMKNAVGREHLALDLSCKKSGQDYYIVTDRWQNMTDTKLSKSLMNQLSEYCSEFLIHGVDVEGSRSGVDKNLLHILGSFTKLPITYAGGVGTLDDVKAFCKDTKGTVDLTIGSALDLFGGTIPLTEVLKICEY